MTNFNYSGGYQTNTNSSACDHIINWGSIGVMNVTKIKLISNDTEQTEQIATSIGARLRGGELIELVSDLGGGKTTFTRGLARGANSQDVVSSPTFTISKVYSTPAFQIHHFDFYRLPNAGLASHEVEDLLGDQKIVLVVEWGGVVDHVLPEERVTINITRTGDESRELLVTYPIEFSYLVEDLC
jgi:tRNA threonylcarbamoyladenosine biosynthesis protein TsaE